MAETSVDLEQAFSLYFREMGACVRAGNFFALVHIILALPDVCAALEEPDAKPGARYEQWCGRYFRNEFLSPAELWDLRCKLLHQGQAIGRRGRYKTYSFPVHLGISVHRAVLEEGNLTLDPRRMADEMRQAVETWFADLRRLENANQLELVRGHLPLLVREQPKSLPGWEGPSFYVMSST